VCACVCACVRAGVDVGNLIIKNMHTI